MAAVVVSAIVQLLFFGGFEENLVSTLLATGRRRCSASRSALEQRGAFGAQPISALILLFYTTHGHRAAR